jgi:protein-tyrosine-phosphatase
MAEALMRHFITTYHLPARAASAGLYPSGSPATPDAVQVMADKGLDLSGHVSRQIDLEILGQADLILAMAREHVREVAVADVTFLGKTFTLKELVSLGEVVGPRWPGEELASWCRRLTTSRRREALLGVGHDEAYDVDDPIGGTKAKYRATALELEELLARAVALLWPDGPGGPKRPQTTERTA